MTTQPKTAVPTDSAPNNAESRIVAFRAEIHTPEADYNANVPIDLIERDPANRVPTEAAVVAIAESIKAEGLLQPIVLRPLESGSYRLIAGEHRWRAYLLLKRETIAARIYKDESELSAARKSAIENFSREQLTPIERAKKFKQLADLGMKQKEIGALLGGLSQPVVANAMRLLDLPEAVQAEIIEGRLSEAHGVALTKWARWPRAVALIARMAAEWGWASKELSQQELPFAGQLEQEGLLVKITTAARYLRDEVIFKIPKALKDHPDFIHGEFVSYYFVPEDPAANVWAPEQEIQEKAYAVKLEAEVLKTAAAVAKGGAAGKEAAERAAVKEKNKAIRAENVAALATAFTKLKRAEAPNALMVAVLVEASVAGGFSAKRISAVAELVGVKLPKGLPSENGGQGMRDLGLMRKMDVMDLTRVAVGVLLSKLTDDANKNAWALPEALGAVMNMALPKSAAPVACEPALLLDVPATPKVKKAKAAKVKAPKAKPAKAGKKGGRK